MDMLIQIGYIVLGAVVLLSALGMVLSHNAVHAALLLAFNFVSVALIYLSLGAPFIALVQITVYAGSIMVLFMFVIMLLGAERMSGKEPIKGQRFLVILCGGALALEVGMLLLNQPGLWVLVQPFDQTGGNPAVLGMALFNQYPLLLIVLAFILLTATVGAILLTRGEISTKHDFIQGKE